MLIIDLDLDLLRLEVNTPDFSVLAFLASRPVSISMDCSLGLFSKDPGGASLDLEDGLEPQVGILDILNLFGGLDSLIIDLSRDVDNQMYFAFSLKVKFKCLTSIDVFDIVRKEKNFCWSM